MVPLYKKDAAIHQLSTWVTKAWVSTYARILLSSAQRINQGLRVYQQTQQANQSFSADYYGRVIFSAFFVNRHKASFMFKKKQTKKHPHVWMKASFVCVRFNWGRVSTLSLWMCLPLLLCVSVGGEENTAVHVMNTLCDTCLSQGCWV